MPDNAPQPDTNKGIIFIVVLALVFNASVIVASLCYCLVMRIELNQTLLNSVLSIGNFLLGAIAGMLTKTSPTQATSPAPATAVPSQVHVTNQPGDPVPTTTEPKP